MMEIFLSGEIDAQVADDFRRIRNEISHALKELEEKDYGDAVISIGIIPICVNLTPELEEAGFYKERKLYKRKDKEADFRLRIDINKLLNGNEHVKRLLIVMNIIDSIRQLGEKARVGFDAKKLEQDILKLLNIDDIEIEDI